MADQYKPSGKEVLEEVLKGDYISRATKPVRDFCYGFVKFYSIITTFPYAVPSYVRKFRNKEYFSFLEKGTNAMGVGLVLGSVAGAGTDVFQLASYIKTAVEDHPAVLLIPVATNAVSAVYEMGRRTYLNARDKLEKEYLARPKVETKFEVKEEPKPKAKVVKTAEQRTAEQRAEVAQGPKEKRKRKKVISI